MIKILKLITGEELIGDVTLGAEVTTIKQPCSLQLVPSGRGDSQPMMAMIPYAMYTEDHRIVVDNEHVIWLETPVTEMYNQYNQVFGSGIQIAGL